MISNSKKIFSLIIAMTFATETVFGQAVVNINKSIQFQKIDGFGTQFGKRVSWDSGAMSDEDHLKRIIDDLGISMHRVWIDPKLEMVNDNDDPNNTDLEKFKDNLNITAGEQCEGEYVSQQTMIDYMKLYKARALRNGDTINFYGTVITPPHWMKYTKCTFGTDNLWNRLITSEEDANKSGTAEVIKDRKDEFAEWLYGTLRSWKDAGMELSTAGIQNEPAWGQPYGSCVYEYQGTYAGKAMASVIRVTGKRLEKEGVKTKIMFPEDIGDLSRFLQYVRAINADSEAKKYGEVIGIHQYNQDGVTPGSISASAWNSMYKVSQLGMVRPVWMTETSGFGTGEKAMMKMAGGLYTALKFGKVNAWNWYDATDNDSDIEHASAFFVNNNGKQVFTKKAQAFRHYSKYIRPGSISVEATCTSDEAVLPLAFQDNYRKRLTIILINYDSVNTKTVTLKFADNTAPKKLLGYRTSMTDDWKKIDSININAVITLPPNSISTYIGNDSKPVVTSLFSYDKSVVQNKLLVHPNPSQGGFYVHGNFDDASDIEIKLLNLQGQELQIISYPNNGNEMYVNTENLANGIYILNYQNQYQKVVVNR